MRKLTDTIFVILIGVAMGACSGGGGSGGGNDPNAGFKLSAFAVSPLDSTVIVPTAGNIQGVFVSANGTTTGTLESFNRDFGGVGLLVVTGAKVPGLWQFRLGPNFVPGSLCLQPTITNFNMSLNDQKQLRCPGLFLGFTSDPGSINALNPPASIMFTGKGLDNSYGSPALAFYNEFGYVVASTQVSQLFWDGASISGIVVDTPNISQVYDGTYTVVVHNISANGSWEVIGAAPITIYGNPPPPPPPGGDGDGGGCGQGPPDIEQLPCN